MCADGFLNKLTLHSNEFGSHSNEFQIITHLTKDLHKLFECNSNVIRINFTDIRISLRAFEWFGVMLTKALWVIRICLSSFECCKGHLNMLFEYYFLDNIYIFFCFSFPWICKIHACFFLR